MVYYGMLCYHMLWYDIESMVCYEISMLCYEISMLCYAMVYVVKDKYSATVEYQASQFCFVFSAERLCVMFLLYRIFVFEHVNALERKRERMSERRILKEKEREGTG